MDIEEEIKFPTNDSNWVTKVLIGGLLGMIPIINFIVGGYYLNVLKGGFENKSELPEWDDWGGMFIKGLVMFAISLVYMIIPIIVIFISMSIIFLTFLSNNTVLGIAGIGILIMGSLIGIILILIFGFFLPMALAMYVNEDLIGAAFKFKEITTRIKSVLGDYITVYLVIIVLCIILGLIANVPFIGWIIIIFGHFYIGIIASNMFGKIFINSTV